MGKEPLFFERMKQHLGECLVFFGALLLFIGYLFGWTKSNVFLVATVLLIAGGIAVYVRIRKT